MVYEIESLLIVQNSAIYSDSRASRMEKKESFHTRTLGIRLYLAHSVLLLIAGVLALQKGRFLLNLLQLSQLQVWLWKVLAFVLLYVDGMMTSLSILSTWHLRGSSAPN
jgi:hypothetical protein